MLTREFKEAISQVPAAPSGSAGAGLSCFLAHPDGRSTRYDRRTSLRSLAVLNVLFKYACSRLVLTALSRTSPRRVVRHAGLKRGQAETGHSPTSAAPGTCCADHRPDTRAEQSPSSNRIIGTLTRNNLHVSPPDGRSTRKKAVIRVSCLVIRENHGRRTGSHQKKCLTALSPTSTRHVVRHAG